MNHSLDAEPAEARTDMTPMIDVVFLMIVFFVCLDFRVLEAKLPAWLPRDVGGHGPRVEPEPFVTVRVHTATPGTPVRHGGANGRYALVGHTARWEIGPRRFTDLAAARRELARIAGDPDSVVRDHGTGERRLLRCVVEATPGVRYDDVAKAADACRAAGFTDITFGGA